jgi:hypothetical protein
VNSPETVEFPGSSNLSRATYDPATENLEVEFQSGERYVYMNVPAGVYRQFGLGGGKYFYAHIRSRYQYERL